MDFKKSVMDAIEVVKLNGSLMTKLAADKNATIAGAAIIAIAGFAYAIGTLNPFGIILLPIMFLIGTFIGFGLLHLLAKQFFGGKATFTEFFNAGSHAYILSWIAVIPLLGPMIAGLASLWELVVAVFVLKNVHKLTMQNAVIVVAILVVAGIIISFIIGAIAATSFYWLLARRAMI